MVVTESLSACKIVKLKAIPATDLKEFQFLTTLVLRLVSRMDQNIQKLSGGIFLQLHSNSCGSMFMPHGSAWLQSRHNLNEWDVSLLENRSSDCLARLPQKKDTRFHGSAQGETSKKMNSSSKYDCPPHILYRSLQYYVCDAIEAENIEIGPKIEI